MTLLTLEHLSANGEDCLLWCITAVLQPFLERHLPSISIAMVWASARHEICTIRSYKEAVQHPDDLMCHARAIFCYIILGLPRSAIRHFLSRFFPAPVPPCAQQAQ